MNTAFSAGCVLQLQAYKCNEYSQEVMCDTLPSPPPPLNWCAQEARANRSSALRSSTAPLSAFVVCSCNCVPAVVCVVHQLHPLPPVHASSSSRRGGHTERTAGRRLLSAAVSVTATSDAAPAGPSEQAAPSELIGVGAPPVKATKGCMGYFREISFIQSVTLLTSLSGTNSSWTFTTDSCSMEWVSATMPVPGDVYSEDLGNPNAEKNMEWCYSWPMHFRPPSVGPTVFVRSSSDPYIMAGADRPRGENSPRRGSPAGEQMGSQEGSCALSCPTLPHRYLFFLFSPLLFSARCS